MRGKLVEQDPNDEPVAELLKRIERRRRGCEEEIKRKAYATYRMAAFRPSRVGFGQYSNMHFGQVGYSTANLKVEFLLVIGNVRSINRVVAACSRYLLKLGKSSASKGAL